MIDPFHLEAYGETTVNYNRDVEIFPVLRTIFETHPGNLSLQVSHGYGRQHGGQLHRGRRGLLPGLPTWRSCAGTTPPARSGSRGRADDELGVQAGAADEAGRHHAGAFSRRWPRRCSGRRSTGAPAGAMVLPDGTVVTGKTSDPAGGLGGAAAQRPEAPGGHRPHPGPHQRPGAGAHLPAENRAAWGGTNPRLHSDEVLIALCISAVTNPIAARAQQQLPKLQGCDAHFTVVLSEVDEKLYKPPGDPRQLRAQIRAQASVLQVDCCQSPRQENGGQAGRPLGVRRCTGQAAFMPATGTMLNHGPVTGPDAGPDNIQHVENVVASWTRATPSPSSPATARSSTAPWTTRPCGPWRSGCSTCGILQQRREAVKASIEEQGKLTEELSAAIDAAATLAEVEDLYRPYKQKRRTRATMAREKGLEPLADAALRPGAGRPRPGGGGGGLCGPGKGRGDARRTPSRGPRDIVAERISDDAALRKSLRALLAAAGRCSRSQAATEEDSVYRLYYDFSQPALPAPGPPGPGHQPGRAGGISEGLRGAGPGGGPARPSAAAWWSPGSAGHGLCQGRRGGRL